MPLFRYEAIDPYGEPLEGTMEESSAHRVTLILQERGAQVNAVEQLESQTSFGRRPTRLGWDDVALINEQLLSITRAKVPVSPSVQAMAKDIENRRLRPVLDTLQRNLESGLTFEEALRRSPKRFPSIYLSLIRAGERSGNLRGVMEMMSSYSTRILDLRDRIVMAMVYPTFVLIVALISLVNLLLIVVPSFDETFREFGTALPPPTAFLIDTSRLVREHVEAASIGMIVFVIGVALGIYALRRQDSGRAFLDRLREFVPIIGRTFRTISLARFSKALGLLLQGRVPTEESLDLAAAAASNEFLRARVRKATAQVSNGETVADSLSDACYFPASYLWFIQNGEARNELPDTLIELSETYEREVSSRDKAMLHLLSPLTIFCLGVIVFFIVVALYLPIFALGDALTGG